MTSCQAINCGNVKGQVKGKSFFQIPDPTKSKAHKALCNKSAAGMQHTPPPDIFNAKKIIFETRPFHAKFEENR